MAYGQLVSRECGLGSWGDDAQRRLDRRGGNMSRRGLMNWSLENCCVRLGKRAEGSKEGS